ncbi:hypothetical protein B0H14DRAFT_3138297 [Mycena olivaceomarginata]|nr:hypothetical protein B0H14DRAFT_3138297 [Mycena olivaceomarginata]
MYLPLVLNPRRVVRSHRTTLTSSEVNCIAAPQLPTQKGKVPPPQIFAAPTAAPTAAPICRPLPPLVPPFDATALPLPPPKILNLRSTADFWVKMLYVILRTDGSWRSFPKPSLSTEKVSNGGRVPILRRLLASDPQASVDWTSNAWSCFAHARPPRSPAYTEIPLRNPNQFFPPTV